MTIRSPRPAWLALAGALLALTAAAAAPVAQASTESSMNSTLLILINSDRAALGLRSLRTDSRLVGLAAQRAGEMAVTGQLAHGVEIGAAERSVGVRPYLAGEAIGETNAAWGLTAAVYIYGLWRASPEHWGLITSDRFNYIGIGVAYEAAGAATFATLVFAEEPDISPPVTTITSARRIGATLSFTWTGRDGILQTHTAGLRDFQVDYKVDGSGWRAIWSATTRTGITLTSRPAGHMYTLAVRSRDWRNNYSTWAIRSVRVP